MKNISGSTRRLVDRIAKDPQLVGILLRREFGYTRRNLWWPSPQQKGTANASERRVTH
jgi:hypothetical protein